MSSLFLYHLTLKHPSLPFKCIIGHFSGQKKVQELVLISSTVIETYLPNKETGKLEKQGTQPVFGLIEDAEKLRLLQTQKDVLVITADSGNVIIAQYNPVNLKFEPIVQEPHSKNGLRRLTPGFHLSVDPQNRALMIGAVERLKIVYKVENDQSSGQITLSSPLEVTSRQTLTLELCALDTNYENPVWAAIEIDYKKYENDDFVPELSPLILSYYELDYGLNYVVHRKSKSPLPSYATLLIPLPGHIGGVLIACNFYLIYESSPDSPRIYIPLPVREDSENGSVITSFCTHILKKKDFFILLQTSLGDLLKLTADFDLQSEKLEGFAVSYFDSIPPANGLHIFKSGFLFANVANDSKLFYQFESLGEENETTCHSKSSVPDSSDFKVFRPEGLRNLALVDIMDSLGPILGCQFVERRDKKHPDPLKQLITLSSHSYLKTLTYGLPVAELVTAPIPIIPTAIFTTSLSAQSVNDDYLVLTSSLLSKTLVLSIGEVVEEVSESGFLTDQHTIGVEQVGQHSIVQIHSNGIRHIRHSFDSEGSVTSKKYTDWFPPAGINIQKASGNGEQIVIALSNRELCYFEVDPSDDQLVEYQRRYEVSGVITAVAVCSLFVSKTERKSRFAVVGCSDETIQVISLDSKNCFEVLTLQALSANCSSLLYLPKDQDSDYVHIGMVNGIYARVSIDKISGKLRDTRLKYLGTAPVFLRILALPNSKQTAVLAVSSRPWAGFFNNEGNFKLSPLMNSDIVDGASFYSEDIGSESVVGIYNDNITIFQIANEESGGFDINTDFAVSQMKLRFYPKKSVKYPGSDVMFVIESEYGTVSPYQENEDIDEDYYHAFGYPKRSGQWASCVQMVNLTDNKILQTVQFDSNECPVSATLKNFKGENYLIVGTCLDLKFLPPTSGQSYLYCFRIKTVKRDPVTIEFVHKTRVEGEPSAMIPFEDKLLVGIKGTLWLYDFGQKQLLKKSSTTKTFLRRINHLVLAGGDVIIVGDSSESVSFFKFDHKENQFFPISNDTSKRQITAMTTVDSKTVISGDKFGNIFVNRLPENISSQVDNSALLKTNENTFNGSCSRLLKTCEFFILDIPTSFQSGSFVTGGSDSFIYTGLQGTIGLMLPVTSQQDVKFLRQLEQKLRDFFDSEVSENRVSLHGRNFLGKDHIKFRGYMNPVKNVFDGDFAEKFIDLPSSAKVKIAGELDRSPREVERKLYDLRNKAAF